MRNRACLGHENVFVVAADLAARGTCLAGNFHEVLLDAPCSGTGTFRRHPELRWRLQEKDVRRMAARQSAMIANAADLVLPGGRLLYSVCSLEPEEGEEVVNGFLESHAGFRLSDPRENLPQGCRRFLGPDGMLRTSPEQGGCDGFFAALLHRCG
jgi:16S rRNA (cytosine967-C5)-methyltransferase